MSLISKIFKSKGAPGNYALALDIGTSVVKALIFKVTGDKEALVLGVGRKEQRVGDMQSGAVTNIPGVIDSCKKAINEAARQADGIYPDQVILGIAGELVKGTTTVVHYERLKSKTKIDLAELKNIIHKVQWKAFDRVRAQLAWETGQSEIDVKLINAAIVDVQIDGYRVTNPIGFQGKDVSISVFNAYAPLVHLGSLQTIASELNLDLLSIAAEPYAVARCLESGNDQDFSAIFFDIGGGTTDIAIVRNGGLEGTRMFALGGKAFTNRLAQELEIDFLEAEKIKLNYSEGRFKGEISEKIDRALIADARVWLSGVELALSEFSSLELLPGRILLCGGGSLLPVIKKVLSGKKWVSNLPFSKDPKVSFIKPQDIKNIKDQTGRLTTQQDITPMALANLALGLTGEEKVLQGILRKVVRLMQT